MLRPALALPLLLACARSATTPAANVSGGPAYVAQEGDTVYVLLHKVRPGNRAEYERFMTEVWFPRAQKIGAKHAEYGAALARRWRLVGTEPTGSDSLYTYLFLYPAFEVLGGVYKMWRQIGVPEDQVVRDSTTQVALIEVNDGFAAVRREYSR